MATFTFNHELANSIEGTPIAYVVGANYSDTVSITVNGISGADAAAVKNLVVYDSYGQYLGVMSNYAGSLFGHNDYYTISLGANYISNMTGDNLISVVALNEQGQEIGRATKNIKTVQIPKSIDVVEEVKHLYDTVEIRGYNNLAPTLRFSLPGPVPTISIAGVSRPVDELMSFLLPRISLSREILAVSDGNKFEYKTIPVILTNFWGKELSKIDMGEIIEKIGWGDGYSVSIPEFEIKMPGTVLDKLRVKITFENENDSSLSISKSKSLIDEEEKLPLISIRLPGLYGWCIDINCDVGFSLDLFTRTIEATGKEEYGLTISASGEIEPRVGGYIGVALKDNVSLDLIKAGVYGNGTIKGSYSLATETPWNVAVNFSLSCGVFLDALSIKVLDVSWKLLSYKYEIAKYDKKWTVFSGKLSESGISGASALSASAAVNYFMKDGISCDKVGNQFTFSVSLEAKNMKYIFKAIELGKNIDYKVVLRYAEVKDNGGFGERKEAFVNYFNGSTCAALSTTLTLDDNKTYAYSFVLIPVDQDAPNIDFASSSDVYYTNPTLTVEKITVIEPDAAPNMTTVKKAEFTVKLNRAVDYDIKLDWFIARGGTAENEVDFVAPDINDRVVTIKKGETEATFSVNILGDEVEESDENFYVKMYTFGEAQDKVVFSAQNLMADHETNWGFSECVIKDSHNRGAAAITVIDVSGSMRGNRLSSAKNAAYSFINNMNEGDYIGVVSFSSSASTRYALTKITDESVKTAAKSAVSSLYADGLTFIGSGIQQAANMLNGVDAKSKSIIVMTDGYDEPASNETATRNIINSLPKDQYLIYGIGYGTQATAAANALAVVDPNVTLSTSYASKTYMEELMDLCGGKYYYAATNEDLEAIYFDLSARSSNQEIITKSSDSITNDGFTTKSIWVDSDTGSIRIGINWTNGDLDLVLWDPNGNYYDSTVDSENVKFVSTGTSEYYEISIPTKGVWGLGIVGTTVYGTEESFDYYAIASSNISTDLSFDATRVAPNQQISINCSVKSGDVNTLGATVFVKVQDSQGEYELVELYDDGMHGDGIANDGVYGNIISRDTAGVYKVTGYVEGTAIMGDTFIRQTVEEQFQVDVNAKASQISVVGNFGSDGKSAIIQYDYAKSQNVTGWFAQDDGSMKWQFINTVASGWEMSKLTGDFTGDGTADIMWINRSTGHIGSWQMDDNSYKWSILTITDFDEWSLQGAGDFNGDGTDDILFRNRLNGLVGALAMKDGEQVPGSWRYLDGTTDAWQIVGTGDFNGDEREDILLTNTVSGQVGIWEMTASGTTSWKSVSFTDFSEWRIQGIGDFNGDGTDDILFASNATGVVGFWGMENGACKDWTLVGIADVKSDWQISGIGDFNDDGVDEIAWTSPTSERIGCWTQDEENLAQWSILA